MADDLIDDGWPTHATTRDGRRLPRVRYGDEPDDWGADRRPCRDCGVNKGEYHISPLCEVERCPSCGGQFVSCECDFVGDADDEENDEEFGTADDYRRAFAAVLAEGVPAKHRELLQAHYTAPDHTATWAQLAAAVGYASGNAVNLQYGRLAGRVAGRLGIAEPPHGFWLYVLAGWADDRDPVSGHTAFVLRRPVIDALQQLGVHPAATGGSRESPGSPRPGTGESRSAHPATAPTRAISIRQPYVEQILCGEKVVEYRSRRTNLRERVYLYASLTPGSEEDFEELGLRPGDLPTGVIVGTVEIVDCTGDEGDYEWHLANPVRLDRPLHPKNQPQPGIWRPQF